MPVSFAWRAAAALVFLAQPLALPAQSAEPDPSFDCHQAHTAAEKAICNSPVLSDLDRQIAARYAELRGAMDTRTAKALRADQKWFVSVRNGEDEVPTPTDLEVILKDRLAFLNNIKVDADPDVQGSWSNEAGDILIERDKAGGLSFSANAAEPSTGRWVCDVSGSLQEAGQGSWTVSEDDPKATRIGLQLDGMSLVVSESGAPEYCGLNGGLAGVYFQSAKAAD